MLNRDFRNVVDSFVSRLKEAEQLHPQRRFQELKNFGPLRSIAQKYFAMHPDRRNDYLRAQRRRLVRTAAQEMSPCSIVN